MKLFFFISVLFVNFWLFAQVTEPHIVNFNNHPIGIYTQAMAKQDFPEQPTTPVSPNIWNYYDGMDKNRAEIIENGSGKALRVKYPEGCVGPNDEPIGCGIQIRWELPEKADTMWISYNLKFEEGFDFVKGGKLPGLCGGKCYSGGNRPSVGDGWSARIMWKPNQPYKQNPEGKIIQYMYFVDQEDNYGDQMRWDYDGTQEQFIIGNWHNVTTQVILNTVPTNSNKGNKNGVVRSWFDGELAMYVDTLRLVDFAEQNIGRFLFSTFHGGDDASWAPTKDSYAIYDDFYISVNPPPNFAEEPSSSSVEEEPSCSSSEEDDENVPILQQNISNNFSINLFKNKLSFSNSLQENTILRLYNSKGNEVLKISIVPGQNNISTPNLANGIYIWSIKGKIFKHKGILANSNL